MAMVGPLHKRSFTTGFLRVQSWVQYSLLCKVIVRHRCGHHRFADDIQLHQPSTPSDFHSLIVDVEKCVDCVGRWMTGNRIKLNNDKIEALLVGSRKRVSVLQDNHLRALCLW